MIAEFNKADTPTERIAYLAAIGNELKQYQKSVDDFLPMYLEALGRDITTKGKSK